MFAKLGFILLVIAFGALMFAAGTIVPPSVREAVVALIGKIDIADLKLGKPVPTPPAAGAAKPNDKKPVPYEELLVPTPLPPNGTYALQIGMYADASNAESFAKQAKDSGYPVLTIPVVDKNGAQWTAVAVGKYASPDEAAVARPSVANRLASNQPLIVIRVPPEPKAG